MNDFKKGDLVLVPAPLSMRKGAPVDRTAVGEEGNRGGARGVALDLEAQ